MKYACHCCGYLTHSSPPVGTYEICPVCFWQEDAVQSDDPSYLGGANQVSLAQARSNFATYGACEEAAREFVRPPLPDELP